MPKSKPVPDAGVTSSMSRRTAPTPFPAAQQAPFEFLPDDAIIPVARMIPTVLPVHDIPTVDPIVTVEPVRSSQPLDFSDPALLFVRLLQGFGNFVEWCFGFVALMVGLAFLAAIPVVQFLTLGYLLEAGGRLARTRKFSEAFIGIRVAARLGGIAGACWLFMLPVRLLADYTYTASIVDPGGTQTQVWRAGLFTLIVLTGLHLGMAIALGGKLRHFISPLNGVWLLLRILRGGYYAKARDAVWDTVIGLRLPYYFWLGLRGFAVGAIWIVLPVSMIAFGRIDNPAMKIIGFIGGGMLIAILPYVPFLQMRMAEHNRFAEGFNWLEVRRTFRRSPWLHAFAFVITLLFAVPLYLLKIEAVPSEAAWLPSLLFVSFIFPSKILTGWALARANRRTEPRHFFFRWTGRLVFWPAATAYVVVVFFTQFTSWNGVWSLFEQHAFLVPVPLFKT